MTTMKALTLHQPYASLMAYALKRNETRSRQTRYRGDVVICAGLRRPRFDEVNSEIMFALAEIYNATKGVNGTFAEVLDWLPLGKALCTVEVFDCVSTDLFEVVDQLGKPAKQGNYGITPLERAAGDYTPARYAFRTRNVRFFKTPVPVVGKQGLFNLDDDERRFVGIELQRLVLAGRKRRTS